MRHVFDVAFGYARRIIAYLYYSFLFFTFASSFASLTA